MHDSTLVTSRLTPGEATGASGRERETFGSVAGRMSIDVATPVYEGPFDLLLQLILKEQVDLYAVDLARIVDAYLVEIEHMQSLYLDVATEFLLIAATLVELKARRLLPGSADVDLDEELALWEERDLLLARLLECKTFKDVAAVFSRLANDADRSFPRAVGPDERFAALVPDLLEGTTVERLRNAAVRALTPTPVPTVDLFHVAPIRITVADAVAELVDELPRVGRITFRRLTADLVDRIEVIVRFLAVLELFKQGVIELEQTERFGDIEVLWTAASDVLADELAIDVYEG
jgi:segregation and condensation protein A